MSQGTHRPSLLVLDREPGAPSPLYDTARQFGSLKLLSSLDELIEEANESPRSILLLDIATLRDTSRARLSRLQDLRKSHPTGLVTDLYLEQYLMDLRSWGIYQVMVKTIPTTLDFFQHFVDCLKDPGSGFGLMRYMQGTCEVYARTAKTLEDKHRRVGEIIDHFATSGFDVHELYDVRLVLEEVLNNAFFHAFKDAEGNDKYNIHDFTELEEAEQIRIEFGSSGVTAGFCVSDSVGTLTLQTIFHKLERQLNHDGLFDESGRGLYLCRILSSVTVINIREGKQTQIIALFDDRRRQKEPKPFIINYIPKPDGRNSPLDPELD